MKDTQYISCVQIHVVRLFANMRIFIQGVVNTLMHVCLHVCPHYLGHRKVGGGGNSGTL